MRTDREPPRGPQDAAGVPSRRDIAAMLARAPPHPGELAELFRASLGPALARFWAAERALRGQGRIAAHGAVPRNPAVSVIVPIAGRLDLMRHQIVRFSNDPEFRAESGAIELVYVIGDADAEALAGSGRQLFELYGVPFRTLHLGAEHGPWMAANAGAGIASGGALLLMSPGVLPKEPRWLAQMLALYRGLDDCGALGCRLVYGDGAIDHAGLAFAPAPDLPGQWVVERSIDGVKAGFDPRRAAVRVPAVSGACLMIDRAFFAELGGLSADYVWDGPADIDLCLAAAARGRHTYYTPQIELYALEAPVTPGFGAAAANAALAAYNLGKFNEKWRTALARLMASAPVS